MSHILFNSYNNPQFAR